MLPEATASLSLLRSVAEFFLTLARADQIIVEYAAARQAHEREIRLMVSAFEHEELAPIL